MKRRKAIHIWLPEVNPAGGIQAYSRFLLRALNQILPQRAKLVFIKNDFAVRMETTSLQRLICFGALPRRFRTLLFVLTLLIFAFWSRPGLILSGHVHFARIAFLLKRLLGIPYWVIIYGMEVWGEKFGRFEEELKRADRIICISEFMRDQLSQQENLDSSRILVLPTTFSESRFIPAPKPERLLKRLNIGPETKIILTVGRLAKAEAYKGYDRILQALPAVLQVIPDLRYIIVGKGDDDSRIRDMVQTLRLERHVTLAGFVPEDELVDFYNLCDVFAMPSKGEGFGIVYLEAMACGKPVLAGNQDGAVDALQGGVLGVLVDPDHIDLIASKLIEILQGSYNDQRIFDAGYLRSKTVELYGYEQFQKTLSAHLEKFFARLD